MSVLRKFGTHLAKFVHLKYSTKAKKEHQTFATRLSKYLINFWVCIIDLIFLEVYINLHHFCLIDRGHHFF